MLQKRIISFITISLVLLNCSYRGYTDSAEKQDIISLERDPFISAIDLHRKLQEGSVDSSKEKDEEYLKLKEKIEKEAEEFEFTGILKGESNLAIINGDIYESGNIIEGKKILEIKEKSVVLEQEGYVFELELEQ